LEARPQVKVMATIRTSTPMMETFRPTQTAWGFRNMGRKYISTSIRSQHSSKALMGPGSKSTTATETSIRRVSSGFRMVRFLITKY